MMKEIIPLIEPQYLAQVLAKVSREVLIPNHEILPMHYRPSETQAYANDTLVFAEDKIEQALGDLLPRATYVSSRRLTSGAASWAGQSGPLSIPCVIEKQDGGLAFDPSQSIVLIDAFDGACGFANGPAAHMPFAVNLTFIEQSTPKISCSYLPKSGAFLFLDQTPSSHSEVPFFCMGTLRLDGKFGGHYPPDWPSSSSSHPSCDIYHVATCHNSPDGLPIQLFADKRLLESGMRSFCMAQSVQCLVATLQTPRSAQAMVQAFVSSQAIPPMRSIPLVHILTQVGGSVVGYDERPFDPLSKWPQGIVMGTNAAKAANARAFVQKFAAHFL